MCLRNPAKQRKNQSNGVLRGGGDDGGGSVDDNNAPTACRLDIDIIDADAGPSDNAKPGGFRDHVRHDLGLTTNDDPVVASEIERQMGRAILRKDVYVGIISEKTDPLVADWIGDEDARTGDRCNGLNRSLH